MLAKLREGHLEAGIQIAILRYVASDKPSAQSIARMLLADASRRARAGAPEVAQAYMRVLCNNPTGGTKVAALLRLADELSLRPPREALAHLWSECHRDTSGRILEELQALSWCPDPEDQARILQEPPSALAADALPRIERRDAVLREMGATRPAARAHGAP